ncbi:MAG: alpha/beta hydrolase [Myxococcaceae bacterium]|nr:alpha/beta hydrolase [Myxococcaceae bacterium]
MAHSATFPKACGLLAALACLTGCGLAAPQKGSPLSDTAAVADFESRVDQTDVQRTHVFFPASPDGAPAPAQVRGGFVFVQGGAVGTSQYAWLAQALAERGFVVAVPEHDFDLAIVSIDRASEALRLLRQGVRGSALDGLLLNRRVALGGHSLGGVVAGKAQTLTPADALVFLASYADGADLPALTARPVPSLVLAGADDCRAARATVEQAAAQLPSPAVLSVLTGVTHMQFTASDAADLKANCIPEVDLDTAHQRIALSVQRFLEAVLVRKDGSQAAVLRGVPGSEVSGR